MRAAVLGIAVVTWAVAGPVRTAAAAPVFGDIGGVPWAAAAIQGVALLGVMEGTAPGSFDPSGLTTRAQMAVVLGRLMGWGAPAAGGPPPPFLDVASIPAWALPDVAAAVAHGILRGEADGRFHPDDPVTWAQVAVIAARTFSYPRVDAGRVAALDAQLPQGAATPSWAAEDLARDVQAGVFGGDLAARYQPAAAVTRAELAQFLLEAVASASGGAAESGAAADLVTGRVTLAGGGTLRLVTASGERDLPLAQTVAVFRGSERGTLADVGLGDEVQAILAAGSVVWIDVVTAASPAVQGVAPNSTLEGTIEAVTAGQSLTLQPSGGQPVTLPLAPYVTVTLNGSPSQSGALAAGQSATVVVNGVGQASYVSASALGTQAGTVSPNSTVTGTVEAVSGTQSLTLALTGGSVATLPFAPYVSVALNGQASTIGAVSAGQTATVTVNGAGQASYIDVSTLGTQAGTVSPNSTVTGTVEAVSGTQSLTLALSGGPTVTLPLAPGVTVLVDGRTSVIGAVAAGATATVAVDGAGQVSLVDVVAGAGLSSAVTPGSTVTGTVEAVSGTQSLALALTGGSVVTLPLAAGVTVVLNGQVSAIGAVPAGSTVRVVVDSLGQISYVDVLASGAQAGAVAPNSTVTGTVEAVGVGQSLTLALTGGSVVTLPLAPYVAVLLNGQTSAVTALAAGQSVSVTVDGQGEVSEVQVLGFGSVGVPGTVAPGASLSGTLQAVGGTQGLSLALAGGQTVALPLAASVQVTIEGQGANIGDLAVGDAATVSLDGLAQVSGVDVTATPAGFTRGATVRSGSVVGLDAGAASLAIYGAGGLATYTLGPGAPITADGQAGSLSGIELGDNVSVALDAGGQASAVATTTPVAPQQVIRGTLAAVVTSSGVLSVDAGGATTTVDVGQDAVAVRGGQLVILTSLPPGTAVTIVTQAATFGAALVIAGS